MAQDLIELITIAPSEVRAVFAAENGLDPYLEKIRAQIDAFVPDMSTKSSRDEIRSFAAKVVKSKTFLDGLGKAEVATLKELPKKIDANRKAAWDKLEAWAAEVRQPLTDWENAEKARIDRHAAQITWMEDTGRATGSAQELRAALSKLEAVSISPEACEEYEDEYVRARNRAIEQLSGSILAAEHHERDQAELAQFRAAQAEREAADRQKAEEAAARQREADAAARAVEAERRASEAREQALRDEAAAAERRAAQAAEAERNRIAAEKAQEESEAKRRENNKRHAAKVNNEASDAILAVICHAANGTPDSASATEKALAKAIVIAIAKGEIPRVSVAY